MGVVYKGFDPLIGRTVAIKTMLIEGLSAAEFQEYKARFQREAQAAGILAHPNIVTVYDFGEDSGVLYLAMEYLDGKSLQELVEKQNILPVETIVPIFEQVCSALDHAHRSNIVHRDIKPANIMILNSGLVKVTDFGIAKIMSMGMTQAGQILGTPNYMSPEQVKGRKVDGRSDIFALGVILYELVTGEKPFGGQNITTVIYKIINENPIPPRELDSTIHPGLSFVISKALAKSPDERFQTCRELAEALRNYRNLGAEPAPADLHGPDDPHVVQVALGNHVDVSADGLGVQAHGLAQLLQKMPGAEVEDPVDCVDSERVDVILRNPVKSVGNEVIPHFIAVGSVEVNRLSPRSFISVGKIRAEVPEVVSLGPEMVVDDVDDHGQSEAMGAVDQSPQVVRRPGAARRGVQRDAGVAPVAAAGQIGERQRVDLNALAEEALRIGLVERVYPASELMDAARDLARQIASKAPLAVAAIKQAINRGLDQSRFNGFLTEGDLAHMLVFSEDRPEGLKAFAEKREPKFKGQ